MGGRSRAVAAVVVVVMAASLAATASGAPKPRALTTGQRACLVKAVGKKNADLYAKGGSVAVRTKAAAASCTKASTSAAKQAAAAAVAPAATPGATHASDGTGVPACTKLIQTGAYLSEGEWTAHDVATNLRSTGDLRAVVLFVDFADLPGAESPTSIADGWMRRGVDWLRTTSYGRTRIELVPHPAWLRMSKGAATYGFGAVELGFGAFTYEKHRDYIGEALALADPAVDFSRADLVYVVAPVGPAISMSPTFRGQPGTFYLDGKAIDKAVTFGRDAYLYGKTILPHETSHLFGLPDVYAHDGATHRFVGIWDYMGNVFEPTDLTAWHRLKLGYIDGSQIACAEAAKTTEATLTALGASGGVKAVVAKTTATGAVVVENRQKVGNDAGICEAGALVYVVDAFRATGQGPIQVEGGEPSGKGCGYGNRSDAPLQPGQSVTVSGVTVTVVSTNGTDVTVRVARP